MTVLQEHPFAVFNTVLNGLFSKLALSLSEWTDNQTVAHAHLSGEFFDFYTWICSCTEDENQRTETGGIIISRLEVERREFDEERVHLINDHVLNRRNQFIHAADSNQEESLERVQLFNPFMRPVFTEIRFIGLEDFVPFVQIVLNMLIQSLERR